VKWTPGISFVALALWLAAGRRWTSLRALVLAFAVTAVVVQLPFLLGAPSDVAYAYTHQGGRGITAESAWYLLLRPFGLAELSGHISEPAGAPEWANVGATLLQLALVAVVLVVGARARDRGAAVAAAALAPAVFLLANRIFSPQFLVPILVAWAIAAALVARTDRDVLLVGGAAVLATGANAFVYPYALPSYDNTWPAASAVLFASALAVTGWLLLRARMAGESVADAIRSPRTRPGTSAELPAAPP
jgi:hypothetical protein